MAATSWTRAENERFKSAVQFFSAFSRTRFESIAEYVHKSVADVKTHYEEMVCDLLKCGACQIAPARMTEPIPFVHVDDKLAWNREEHEWFLIRLNRFENDWDKISALLTSKNRVQVAIYEYYFSRWESSVKYETPQARVNAVKRVGSRGRRGSRVRPQAQPQQKSMVLEIGQPSDSTTKLYFI